MYSPTTFSVVLYRSLKNRHSLYLESRYLDGSIVGPGRIDGALSKGPHHVTGKVEKRKELA